METSQPDIVVTSPDGAYWIIVEVKLNDFADRYPARQSQWIDQLSYRMALMNCSVGILVCGERLILLRDTLEQADGTSIHITGEAKLPRSLLPPPDHQWEGNRPLEFESQVQQWLEDLKWPANVKRLPDDLKAILREPILSFIRLGDVRAAGPRWSKALQ